MVRVIHKLFASDSEGDANLRSESAFFALGRHTVLWIFTGHLPDCVLADSQGTNTSGPYEDEVALRGYRSSVRLCPPPHMDATTRQTQCSFHIPTRG